MGAAHAGCRLTRGGCRHAGACRGAQRGTQVGPRALNGTRHSSWRGQLCLQVSAVAPCFVHTPLPTTPQHAPRLCLPQQTQPAVPARSDAAALLACVGTDTAAVLQPPAFASSLQEICGLAGAVAAGNCRQLRAVQQKVSCGSQVELGGSGEGESYDSKPAQAQHLA